MKLTMIKKTLAEEVSIALSKDFEADMLKDGKMLDQLAEKLQGQGFPERFELPVKLSTGAEITLAYEMYEKSINEAKSHHQITFTYEHTRDTVVKVRLLLKDAEKDDSDEGGEAYDKLYDELKTDMIHVMAEFKDKFVKVWASTK